MFFLEIHQLGLGFECIATNDPFKHYCARIFVPCSVFCIYVSAYCFLRLDDYRVSRKSARLNGSVAGGDLSQRGRKKKMSLDLDERVQLQRFRDAQLDARGRLHQSVRDKLRGFFSRGANHPWMGRVSARLSEAGAAGSVFVSRRTAVRVGGGDDKGGSVVEEGRGRDSVYAVDMIGDRPRRAGEDRDEEQDHCSTSSGRCSQHHTVDHVVEQGRERRGRISAYVVRTFRNVAASVQRTSKVSFGTSSDGVASAARESTERESTERESTERESVERESSVGGKEVLLVEGRHSAGVPDDGEDLWSRNYICSPRADEEGVDDEDVESCLGLKEEDLRAEQINMSSPTSPGEGGNQDPHASVVAVDEDLPRPPLLPHQTLLEEDDANDGGSWCCEKERVVGGCSGGAQHDRPWPMHTAPADVQTQSDLSPLSKKWRRMYDRRQSRGSNQDLSHPTTFKHHLRDISFRTSLADAQQGSARHGLLLNSSLSLRGTAIFEEFKGRFSSRLCRWRKAITYDRVFCCCGFFSQAFYITFAALGFVPFRCYPHPEERRWTSGGGELTAGVVVSTSVGASVGAPMPSISSGASAGGIGPPALDGIVALPQRNTLLGMDGYEGVFCDVADPDYRRFRIASIVSIILWPFGLLMLALYLVAIAPTQSLKDASFLAQTRFLFFRFRPERYYWGLTLALRSLLTVCFWLGCGLMRGSPKPNTIQTGAKQKQSTTAMQSLCVGVCARSFSVVIQFLSVVDRLWSGFVALQSHRFHSRCYPRSFSRNRFFR